jgi:hypothetical protein
MVIWFGGVGLGILSEVWRSQRRIRARVSDVPGVRKLPVGMGFVIRSSAADPP